MLAVQGCPYYGNTYIGTAVLIEFEEFSLVAIFLPEMVGLQREADFLSCAGCLAEEGKGPSFRNCPKGGQNDGVWEGRRGPIVCVLWHTTPRGVWGHALPENFDTLD